MASGDERVALENVDLEDARFEMFIDRIEAAGWHSAGGFGEGVDNQVNVGFYRRDGLYSLSPEETAIRLGLLDEDGHIITGHNEFDPRTEQKERVGYDVETDPRTGRIVIGYSGPNDETYQALVEDLIVLGHNLKNQQENEAPDFKTGMALAREALAGGDEAVVEFLGGGVKTLDATNKLMRQLKPSEDGKGTIQDMVEAGIPRETAIAYIVSVVASTFCEDFEGEGYKTEVDFLESWHAHVDYRYTKLLEALQAHHVKGGPLSLQDFIASNLTLETLGGIRDGVRQAAEVSRERAEQQEPEQSAK